MADDLLQLKFGAPGQIDSTAYTAGTMYLVKKDASTADLYFDMGGTRLTIVPSTLDSSVAESFVDDIMIRYNSHNLNSAQSIDMINDI